MSLTDEIKKEIGYTEEPAPACKNCKYHGEDENQYVDRMWDDHCRVAGDVVTLRVQPSARCSKFEKAI